MNWPDYEDILRASDYTDDQIYDEKKKFWDDTVTQHPSYQALSEDDKSAEKINFLGNRAKPTDWGGTLKDIANIPVSALTGAIERVPELLGNFAQEAWDTSPFADISHGINMLRDAEPKRTEIKPSDASIGADTGPAALGYEASQRVNMLKANNYSTQFGATANEMAERLGKQGTDIAVMAGGEAIGVPPAVSMGLMGSADQYAQSGSGGSGFLSGTATGLLLGELGGDNPITNMAIGGFLAAVEPGANWKRIAENAFMFGVTPWALGKMRGTPVDENSEPGHRAIGDLSEKDYQKLTSDLETRQKTNLNEQPLNPDEQLEPAQLMTNVDLGTAVAEANKSVAPEAAAPGPFTYGQPTSTDFSALSPDAAVKQLQSQGEQPTKEEPVASIGSRIGDIWDALRGLGARTQEEQQQEPIDLPQEPIQNAPGQEIAPRRVPMPQQVPGERSGMRIVYNDGSTENFVHGKHSVNESGELVDNQGNVLDAKGVRILGARGDKTQWVWQPGDSARVFSPESLAAVGLAPQEGMNAGAPITHGNEQFIAPPDQSRADVEYGLLQSFPRAGNDQLMNSLHLIDHMVRARNVVHGVDPDDLETGYKEVFGGIQPGSPEEQTLYARGTINMSHPGVGDAIANRMSTLGEDYETAKNTVLTKYGPVAVTTYLDDGRQIIHAFKGADMGTLVHELHHVFERQLPQSDYATLVSSLDSKDDKLTKTGREQFARLGEQYIATGQRPAGISDGMQGVLDKFQGWLYTIYSPLAKSPLNLDMDPSVKSVLGNMMARGDPRASLVRFGSQSPYSENTGRDDNRDTVADIQRGSKYQFPPDSPAGKLERLLDEQTPFDALFGNRQSPTEKEVPNEIIQQPALPAGNKEPVADIGRGPMDKMEEDPSKPPDGRPGWEQLEGQGAIERMKSGLGVPLDKIKGTLTSNQQKWVRDNCKLSEDKTIVYMKGENPTEEGLYGTHTTGEKFVFKTPADVASYITNKEYTGGIKEFYDTVAKYMDMTTKHWGMDAWTDVYHAAQDNPEYGDSIGIPNNPGDMPPRSKIMQALASTFGDKNADQIRRGFVPKPLVLQRDLGNLGERIIVGGQDITNESNRLQQVMLGSLKGISNPSGEPDGFWNRIMGTGGITPDQGRAVSRALNTGERPTDPVAARAYDDTLRMNQETVGGIIKRGAQDPNNAQTLLDSYVRSQQRHALNEDVMHDLYDAGRGSRYWKQLVDETMRTNEGMDRASADKVVNDWIHRVGLQPRERNLPGQEESGTTNTDLEMAKNAGSLGKIGIPDSMLEDNLPHLVYRMTRNTANQIATRNGYSTFGSLIKIAKSMQLAPETSRTLEIYEANVTGLADKSSAPHLTNQDIQSVRGATTSLALTGKAPWAKVFGIHNNEAIMSSYGTVIHSIWDTLWGGGKGVGLEQAGLTTEPSKYPLINALRGIHPFNKIVAFDRKTGYLSGLQRIEGMLPGAARALRDGFHNAASQDLLDLEGLHKYSTDVNELVLQGLKWSSGSGAESSIYGDIPRSIANAAINMSRETALPIENWAQPAAWTGSNLMRTLTKFRRFSLQETAFTFKAISDDIGRAGELLQDKPGAAALLYKRAATRAAKMAFGGSILGTAVDGIWNTLTGNIQNTIVSRAYKAMTEDEKGQIKTLTGLYFKSIATVGIVSIATNIISGLLDPRTNILQGGKMEDNLFGFDFSRIEAATRFMTNAAGEAVKITTAIGDEKPEMQNTRNLLRLGYTTAREFIPGMKYLEAPASIPGVGQGYKPQNWLDPDAMINSARKNMEDAVRRGNKSDLLGGYSDYLEGLQNGLKNAANENDYERIKKYDNLLKGAREYGHKLFSYEALPNDIVKQLRAGR